MSKQLKLVCKVCEELIKKKDILLYYIDKEWYNNWCGYFRLDFIKLYIEENCYSKSNEDNLNIKEFLENMQEEEFYTIDNYFKKPKECFNEKIHLISDDKIFNDKNDINKLLEEKIPIDETFYEKIPKDIFTLFSKEYKCQNKIEIKTRICIIIYDKKKKNYEIKYYFPIEKDEIIMGIMKRASSLCEDYHICYFDLSEEEINKKENTLIEYIENNLDNFKNIENKFIENKVFLIIIGNNEKNKSQDEKKEIKSNDKDYNKKDNNVDDQRNINKEKDDSDDDDYRKYFKEDEDNNNKEYNNIIENEKYSEGIMKGLSNKNKEIFLKKQFSTSIHFNDIYKINTINKSNLTGTMGIINIGNNCYMNSVLQCLSNIFPLTEYFLSEKYKREINYFNSSNSKVNIVIAFAELLKIIWNTNIPLKQIDGKNCYYYGKTENQDMIDVFSNLKNEINITFNDYQEAGIIFLKYFLDIVHEGLKRGSFSENNINYLNNKKKKNVNEMFENKWNIFKNNNNSIITDIFFGMNHTSFLCTKCIKTYHMFEAYNIIYLSLYESPIKANKSEVEAAKKKQFIKENSSLIPGKNNFYFCQCIIIPYNISEKKQIVICPLKKTYYDNIKVKDIIYMISYIYNLNDNDLIACVLSEDFNNYKLVCSGEEYLYEIFLRPDNMKIFLIVQINKNVELRKEFNDPNKLFNYFLNPEKVNEKIFNKKNCDNFILGEEEVNISEHTNDENQINFGEESQLYYFKVFSFLLNIKTKDLESLRIPKIFKYKLEDSLITLHSKIKQLFHINEEISFYKFPYFEKFKYNNQKNNFDFDIRNLIDDEMINDKKLYFILCVKLQSNKDYNQNKEYYIPIPYIKQSLGDYLKELNKKYSFDNEYKIKNLRINIIWLPQCENYIQKIENYHELTNVIEINPYNEILQKIIERSENRMTNPLYDTINFSKKENELNLDLLLKYYIDYEKYDKMNLYHCVFCNENVLAFKQTFLYSLPDIVIFYFDRKDSFNLNGIKITFPVNNFLDLSKFSEDENTKHKKYELIGIINYEEKNQKSHYYSFCKNPIKNKWYKFIDNSCYVIDDINKEINYQKVYSILYKNIEFKKYK